MHDYERVHAGARASTCAGQVCGAGMSARVGRACRHVGNDASGRAGVNDGGRACRQREGMS